MHWLPANASLFSTAAETGTKTGTETDPARRMGGLSHERSSTCQVATDASRYIVIAHKESICIEIISSPGGGWAGGSGIEAGRRRRENRRSADPARPGRAA